MNPPPNSDVFARAYELAQRAAALEPEARQTFIVERAGAEPRLLELAMSYFAEGGEVSEKFASLGRLVPATPGAGPEAPGADRDETDPAGGGGRRSVVDFVSDDDIHGDVEIGGPEVPAGIGQTDGASAGEPYEVGASGGDGLDGSAAGGTALSGRAAGSDPEGDEFDDDEFEDLATLEFDVGKVVLEVTDGELAGRCFEFGEHDTFLFGRNNRDCHAALPRDRYLSRHHFLLEVNPPEVRLQDLGSRNGTFVNGIRYGRRRPDATPEEGRREQHELVDLRHGDVLRVGRTSIRVSIEWPQSRRDGASGGADQAATQRIDVADLAPRDAEPCHPTVVIEPAPRRPIEPTVRLEPRDRGEPNAIQALDGSEERPLDMSELLREAAAEQAGAAPRIEGYEVLRKVGDGGMGVVYLARDADGEEVAIKVMLSRVAVDPRSRKIFLRECRVLERLNHAHVVRFLGSGADAGAFYFVMQYCNAGNLHSAHDSWGLEPWEPLGPIMLDVLGGLEYAHQEGVVHRDLKPENILLHRSPGRLIARVSDFGLAKNFQRAGFSGMTATGSVAGTFSYMPREQLTNYKYADPISDIWSIGATFYHMLTGSVPRDDGTDRDPIDRILEGKVMSAHERMPSMPAALADVLDRALEDEPRRRYKSIEAMRRDLAKALG